MASYYIATGKRPHDIHIGSAYRTSPCNGRRQGGSPTQEADVWLVVYDPNVVEVPVGRGENGGRTLPHSHVVHDLVKLGRWTGPAIDFPVTPAAPGLRNAVVVQTINGGPILAAATN